MGKYLILIIFLGSIFRLIFLDKYPSSLNWDEVSHGYNAYSILTTGKDEWGSFLPLTNFRAYGDYPLPLNLYLTVSFIATLGLNEFAIRLPHALLGIAFIGFSYLLSYLVSKDPKIALFTAFLTAISPWSMFTSRFVLQANVAIFFLLLGVICFLLIERKKFFLPLGILFLGLSAFSYHSTRIIAPLMFVIMIFIYRKDIFFSIKNKLILLTCALITVLFFAPLPFILKNPESRARANVVFLLNEGAISSIEQQRATSEYSPTVSRLLYNKATYFSVHFAKNYIEYFSPLFLFINGGTQYQFSIPGRGLLYIVLLPFFYLGLLALVSLARKDKRYLTIVIWLLVAPIPASITSEQFAVVRAMTMLPIPYFVSAMGIFWIEQKIKKHRYVISFLVVIALLISLEGYVINYFQNYSKDYSWAWQYGYKEAVQFAKENYDKYDKIIVTKKYGEPHEYFLFYWPWNPEEYMNDKNVLRFPQSNWWWVDRFDKFYFVNDWQVKEMRLESGGLIECDKKCLLVTSPDNVPNGWTKLTTINFLDGKQAFEIYEN